MGRLSKIKLQLIREANISLLTEQSQCDPSCVDTQDPSSSYTLQQWMMNGQPQWGASTSYNPGDTVCHNGELYMASANSGQLVPGGGGYPAPINNQTAFPWPLPANTNTNDYYWETVVMIVGCTGGSQEWDCINNTCTAVEQGSFTSEDACMDSMCGDRRKPTDYGSNLSHDIHRQKEIMKEVDNLNEQLIRAKEYNGKTD